MYKAILTIFAFLISTHTLFCQSLEKATKGVLDLRHHVWARDGMAELNGEWEFYQQQLFLPDDLNDSTRNLKPQFSNVPEFWNRLLPGSSLTKGLGYATYHLKVLCPTGNDSIALKFRTISTAYKLFVNGTLVTTVGTVGTSAAESRPAYEPQVITVSTKDHLLDIVMQVSNYYYRTGGVWDFIKIGTVAQINHYQQVSLVRDYFITGGFLMMALYHLIVVFFLKRRNSALYMGVLCLIICIRVLSTGEIAYRTFISLPWNINIRLEFVSMFLIMTFSVLFVYSLFRNEFSAIFFRFFLYSSLAFSAFGLVTSPLYISFCTRPFEVLIILCSCYGIYIAVRAMQHKKPEAVFYLASFIILFIALLNDILYSSLIIETGHYFYAGLFLFVLLQAVSLSKQFTSAFSRLDRTNTMLQQSNEELVNKNNIIIEKNEELSKLNKELDGFVYRVSHDLRSPINSVMGIIDLAQKEAGSDKLQQYFQMQQKTLTRLDNIIGDIIDYSRNSRIETRFSVIDFKSIVKNVFEDHQYMSNGLHIRKLVDVTQDSKFICDERRLTILFNNLISNAFKYADKTRDDAFIKVLIYTNSQNALIQISDNGIGIGEKHLDKIFSMFYRATTKEQGTGLGLYIVKEVIEKLNGSITVESVPGTGTTFRIVIPNRPLQFAEQENT